MDKRQASSTNLRSFWVLGGLVLLAAALRFPSLFANSFHGDEALYGSYARLIATWRDPLLQTIWLDKPPLLFYLQALFYAPLGTTASFVARLPGFIASLLLVPLVARLAWQLYGVARSGDEPQQKNEGQWTGWIAAAFIATSPYTIQFSSTAFLDPLMTFWIVAGLVAANRRPLAVSQWQLASENQPLTIPPPRPFAPSPTRQLANSQTLSGLFFGLAVVTKFQAGLFLPLVVGVGALYGWRGRDWGRWLVGLGSVLLLLLGWELVRSGGFTLWQGQMLNYGGLRLSWSWELWPRLGGWASLWQYSLGSPLLGFGLILLLPLFLAFLIQEEDRPTFTDLLFVLFTIGYFLLHWFVAVPIWDRYLLPLMPVIGIILARFTARLVGFFGPALIPILHGLTGLNPTLRTTQNVIFGLLLLAQLSAARAAAQGSYPIGGGRILDDGISEAATWLADEPYGTVLYDHWYGWHWRYYLLETRVYYHWFPHPEALQEDLRVFGREPGARYLLLPPDEAAAAPIHRAVIEAGYTLEWVGTTTLADGTVGVSLYRINH
ncbi:MAG: hypothetical protein KJ063_05150 [Anaerolineae bacterium]|nr:hypothetical protein [Anaerolineae bacterium]